MPRRKKKKKKRKKKKKKWEDEWEDEDYYPLVLRAAGALDF